MNTFVLSPVNMDTNADPTEADYSGIFGKGVSTRETHIKALLKILGYISAFGRNVSWEKEILGNRGIPNLKVSFDAPISFSNVVPTDNSTVNLLETINYDTRNQNVIEWADKPYPVKGLLAVACPVIDFATGTYTGDPTKDLDDYNRLDFYALTDNGSQSFKVPIYIGICNSSKTDFYTPFSDVYSLVFDPTGAYSNQSQGQTSIAQTSRERSSFSNVVPPNAVGLGSLHNPTRR